MWPNMFLLFLLHRPRPRITSAPSPGLDLHRSESWVGAGINGIEFAQLAQEQGCVGNCAAFYTTLNLFNGIGAISWTTFGGPKMARTCGDLYILTSKFASRHNGVHFFNISISKSGPNMVCFDTFDLQMCFAPQRRAILRLSSGQLAPHPPLWRGYSSTLRSYKTLEKHSVSRLPYLFAHLHLLSSDFLHL